MKLFHKEIFWPQGKLNRWQNKEIKLIYSRHAQLECIKDKYLLIHPPKSIVFDESRAFEIELDNNVVINKVAIRIPYDEKHDITLVICPDYYTSEAFIKTLWCNQKTDLHSTLNHSLYSKSI